jgi:hypothetical protein
VKTVKRVPRLTAFLLALSCALAPAGAAQTGVEAFYIREDFNATAASLSTIDFERVAPARGFGMYRPPEGLSVGGVSFRVSGGARFGPGNIYVPSPSYIAGNPAYNTGTGSFLSWSPPNQPGSASLDVTLPGGVSAVGAELWTLQPYSSTVEVTATNAAGGALTVVVNTRERPAGSFVGFISESPIVSVSFRPPKGQPGLILDNFVYGRRAEGRAVRPTATSAVQQAAKEVEELLNRPVNAGAGQQPAPPAGPPTAAPGRQTPAANQPTPAAASQSPTPADARPPAPAPAEAVRPSGPPATNSAAARGTVAYVRGNTEIRLVESDGSNDRRLWTHPDVLKDAGIHDLAWRPDGQELAFSSSHRSVASFYHADLYAVRPDGTGLRKLTNPPEYDELARYPKGVVTVTVRNDQPIYQQAQASAGTFIVYVVGADMPQQVVLPPGASKTLVFKSVADYGDHAQPVVAMYGQYRWFIPGVDVRAGRTVAAPALGISGDGIPYFGAFRPVWRADGSRVSFRDGLCLLNSVPARPTPGVYVYAPLFKGEHPSGACAWDWGPTPALADQLLYTSNGSDGSSVYRAGEGSAHPGTRLHTFSELTSQLLDDLRWLPDGSGFLYSQKNEDGDAANIFRYDFATRRVAAVTRLEGEFARRFDVSPDGAWVVFERARTADDYDNVDLWLVRTDGSGARLLVRGGLAPAWR